jgi:hypothetical protein
MRDQPPALYPEAKELLERLKAAKADQRTAHAEAIEFLACVRAVLAQLGAVCTFPFQGRN